MVTEKEDKILLDVYKKLYEVNKALKKQKYFGVPGGEKAFNQIIQGIKHVIADAPAPSNTKNTEKQFGEFISGLQNWERQEEKHLLHELERNDKLGEKIDWACDGIGKAAYHILQITRYAKEGNTMAVLKLVTATKNVLENTKKTLSSLSSLVIAEDTEEVNYHLKEIQKLLKQTKERGDFFQKLINQDIEKK